MNSPLASTVKKWIFTAPNFFKIIWHVVELTQLHDQLKTWSHLKTYADGYSRKMSTCETFKCPKSCPTSPPLKQWTMNFCIQCFISGLVAPSMFPRWTKSFILKASSRPPFGNVQSRFGFWVEIGGVSFLMNAFDLKHASASGSNFGDTSSENQVSASSSQVLGICPLRVT